MDYNKEYIKKNPGLHLKDSPDKVREILRILPIKNKYESMIDIACGAGAVTLELKKRLSIPKVVGIDISTTMINYAKTLDKNNSVDWINQNIFDLKFAERFDLAVCNDIVEHVNDDAQFLKQVANLSKYAVIKVPLEKSFLARFLKFFHIADVWADTESRYGHIHHYAMKELDELIYSSGFQIEKEGFIPMPKRSKLKWELVRLLFLPITMINKRASVILNGGFKLYYLRSNN